jgi:hypothetical protein
VTSDALVQVAVEAPRTAKPDAEPSEGADAAAFAKPCEGEPVDASDVAHAAMSAASGAMRARRVEIWEKRVMRIMEYTFGSS